MGYIKFKLTKDINQKITYDCSYNGITFANLLENLIIDFTSNSKVAEDCLSMMPYNLYKVFDNNPIEKRAVISTTVIDEAKCVCITLGIPTTRLYMTLCILFAKGEVNFPNAYKKNIFSKARRKK